MLFNIALPENVLKISNNEELYKELVYQKERLDDILDNDFRYETFIILGTNDKICNSTEYVLDHYWKDRVKFCSAEHHLQDSDEDELVTLLKDILDEVNR